MHRRGASEASPQRFTERPPEGLAFAHALGDWGRCRPGNGVTGKSHRSATSTVRGEMFDSTARMPITLREIVETAWLTLRAPFPAGAGPICRGGLLPSRLHTGLAQTRRAERSTTVKCPSIADAVKSCMASAIAQRQFRLGEICRAGP